MPEAPVGIGQALADDMRRVHVRAFGDREGGPEARVRAAFTRLRRIWVVVEPAEIARARLLAMGGQIVNETVAEARRPRLSEPEETFLKEGGTPEGWGPATRQMDRDGRCTLKRGRERAAPPEGGAKRVATGEILVPAFGYKNLVSIGFGQLSIPAAVRRPLDGADGYKALNVFLMSR